MAAHSEVGCAGILVADTFCGPMPSLPREGQLLAVGAMPSKPGGCAANVAITLAKQGAAVSVAGCIGQDSAGKLLLDSFQSRNIDVSPITAVTEHPTSTTVILLVEGEDRRYIHCFGANGTFTVSRISREWIAGLKVFYLGGLYVMPGIVTDDLAELLAFCRSRGVITVVDVVIPDGSKTIEPIAPLLPNIDYFLPNEDEARILTGKSETRAQVKSLLEGGAKTVVVTKGKSGAAAGNGQSYFELGVHKMQSIDPSGAGDAFTSGVIFGALRGWTLENTLAYAAALGGSATRAVGTTDGVFTAEEAEQFVDRNPLSISKMVL